ncbi:MAG: Sua5/YciO/YrdC/YwlC family protein, partial [Dokdonella sp.]
RRMSVPAWLHGENTGIALRVTAHTPAAELCRAFNGAIVSTSANLHGQAAARTAAEVRSVFGDGLDTVFDGVLGGLARPTTIRDAISGETLRA